MPAKYHFDTPGSKANIVPVTEPLREDQIKNDAGGYVWGVSNWQRARRFLILGNEGGSYYASERQMTKENATALIECLKEDGKRLVNLIIEVSDNGLAPKNDPAIFALALSSCKQYANGASELALASLSKVCRTSTHLFMFCEYVQAFRGWGRGLRKAIAHWYTEKSASAVAYQMIKYRQRNGWTHRDLLRLAHPKTTDVALNAAFKWAINDTLPETVTQDSQLIAAFQRVQTETRKSIIIDLILTHNLPREALPTQWLNDADIWEALLQKMPLMAMVRNLGKMSAIELLKTNSEAEKHVVASLSNQEWLQKARIHPIALLSALKVYEQGHGEHGSLKWQPTSRILDALDKAFYFAFKTVIPANKRFLLALDVSGSMGSGSIAGIPGLTPRVGSAAMALVTANTEQQYDMVGFSSQLVPINLSARTRLDDAIRLIDSIPMGGTDCAVPMLYAMERNIAVDTFVVYTDSETWASVHPVQMLQKYRDKTGIPAQLIVVGMTSNGFTLADPQDKGMLDVVGFDSSAPAVMSEFAKGNI